MDPLLKVLYQGYNYSLYLAKVFLDFRPIFGKICKSGYSDPIL